jgi:hypothetical protein
MGIQGFLKVHSNTPQKFTVWQKIFAIVISSGSEKSYPQDSSSLALLGMT